MTNDDAFIAAIASAPGDPSAELVYADWLEERGDAGAAALRLRAVLLAAEYSEADFRRIAELAAQYRGVLAPLDPAWVGRVGRARPWVSKRLAGTLVRVHLRTRLRRREDRQWVDFWCDWNGAWAFRYWRADPAKVPPTRSWWRKQVWVLVDKVDGQVSPALIHL
jgi:uncharacterized protein (TIGR02996 family)